MKPLLFALAIVASTHALPARAAPQTACPPLGAMPNYVPQEARLRVWEPLTFMQRTGTGDDAEERTVNGRTCQISYQLKDGADTLSNLEIQMNYRQQLQALGAVLQSEGARDTYAVLDKDGAQTWFRTYSSETSIELTVLQVTLPKPSLLPPSGNDHRLLGHMPGFVAGKPEVRNFDKMTFTIMAEDGEREVGVQGRTFVLSYQHDDKALPPSDAETIWNYTQALRALGAELLNQYPRGVTARLLRDGQVIWIGVASSETSVEVRVVEERPFEPTVKPAQAQLQTALAGAGRVALYVNFDFDRAVLRPEAAPVVAQVAAMLKADPALRLSIEGHTDSLGAAERNRTLSAERAAAFAAAVAAQGVAPDRLTSAGFGPDKPVATNDTSEGRARNRRVELVRM